MDVQFARVAAFEPKALPDLKGRVSEPRVGGKSATFNLVGVQSDGGLLESFACFTRG